MDPYAYVGGNPETFSDPSGQRFAPPPGGGDGGGGGAAGGGGGDGGAAGGHGGSHTGLSNAQQSQLNSSCPYDPNSNASCFASQSRTQSFQVVPGGTCGTGGRRQTGINIASGGPSFIDSGIGVQIVPGVSLTATTEIGIGSSAGCGEPSGVV